VELVPNGSDTQMFDPYDSGLEFRQAHNLEGQFVALYAGAHGMSNDLGMLLEAARLLAERAGITIVLLGAGKEKAALIERANEMGLSNVLFLPPVPKAQMGQALAAADACIAILKPVPMYATVYPNKVFDYMAAGRPVILAIDGVIRQVVEGAQAGIFTPPGDPQALAVAIRRLADDRTSGREMGMRGRECVQERFDRGVLAEQLASVMEKLADSKN
jgi:glycosyltransferase involved in cell wall biosynthesis